ncbi:hypothetical protein NEFER03_1092 [Nematocida sp. LUAm3]|nr:hypothetical protein NEFER03_1092 [Nematocida sp. LUAm3]KAI5175303.1 hypothetical protein NEFER02_1232 [Nematocida sp. LUAm2]KAI5177740.1 hypothetical protein NEFER01_0964 [Nematocida sp. LUAm1]
MSEKEKEKDHRRRCIKYTGPLLKVPPAKTRRIKPPLIYACIRSKPSSSMRDIVERHIKDPDYIDITSQLEKKSLINTSVFLLKRRKTVNGINMAVLDLLDVRNTYLWVQVFREKIIENRWTEEEAREVFHCCLSKDLLTKRVKAAKSLRDAVRVLYDLVYTQEAVHALRKRIYALSSAQFSSLYHFKEELDILIGSYAVKVPLSEEEQKRFLQIRFWDGMSSGIKEAFKNDITKYMDPHEIIQKIYNRKHPVTFSYVPAYCEQAICAPLKVVPFPMEILKHKSRSLDLIRAMEKRRKIPQNVIFHTPERAKPFLLDALQIGNCLGGMLYQDTQPIAFFFENLMKTSCLTETEADLLAINISLSHIRKITHGCSIYAYLCNNRAYYIHSNCIEIEKIE